MASIKVEEKCEFALSQDDCTRIDARMIQARFTRRCTRNSSVACAQRRSASAV